MVQVLTTSSANDSTVAQLGRLVERAAAERSPLVCYKLRRLPAPIAQHSTVHSKIQPMLIIMGAHDDHRCQLRTSHM